MFTRIETSDSQVAVIAGERKVVQVIALGKRDLFWRGVLDLTFALVDVLEAPARLLAPLRVSAASAVRYLRFSMKASADSCISMGGSSANWAGTEETVATRSLLKTLRKIADKVDRINVVGRPSYRYAAAWML